MVDIICFKSFRRICIFITTLVLFFLPLYPYHVQAEDLAKSPITLSVGDMTTIQLKGAASRINIGTSDIVGLFMGEKQLLVVRAKNPGFTNLLVQYESGVMEQFDIFVMADSSLDVLAQHLQGYLKSLGDIDACIRADKIVLQGYIDDSALYNRYKQIVLMYKDYVIDNVQYGVKGKRPLTLDDVSSQVQIDVKVVQIIHTDALDLGIEWFSAGPWEVGAKGSIDYQDPGGTKFSALVNADKVNLKLIALAKKGKAKFLATPKLVVQSGKQANFLVGGEVPIAQITAVSSDVEWKKYGTELYIAPTIKSDTEIYISLMASVSDLDYANAINNFPALRTRATDTNITLNSGETFAIAGFLGYEVSDTVSKVPLLGDIPFIKPLFTNKGKKLTRIETIIFITPHILSKTTETEGLRFKSNIFPTEHVQSLINEDIATSYNKAR
jgi:pilus assembly protein CpaC